MNDLLQVNTAESDTSLLPPALQDLIQALRAGYVDAHGTHLRVDPLTSQQKLDYGNSALVFGDLIVSALVGKQWTARATTLQVLSENIPIVARVLKGHPKAVAFRAFCELLSHAIRDNIPKVFEKAVSLVTAAFPPSTSDVDAPAPLFPRAPGSDVRSLVQDIMPTLADRLTVSSSAHGNIEAVSNAIVGLAHNEKVGVEFVCTCLLPKKPLLSSRKGGGGAPRRSQARNGGGGGGGDAAAAHAEKTAPNKGNAKTVIAHLDLLADLLQDFGFETNAPKPPKHSPKAKQHSASNSPTNRKQTAEVQLSPKSHRRKVKNRQLHLRGECFGCRTTVVAFDVCVGGGIHGGIHSLIVSRHRSMNIGADFF